LLIATRAIHFAATGMTAGVLLFVPYVGDPAFGGQGAARSAGAIRFRARLLRIAWIGLLATVGSGAIWVLLESAAMSGASLADAVDSGAPWTVLSETHFGMVADIRLLIAVGLAASLTFAGTSRLSLWIATALAAFLLAAIASTGHAAGTPGLAGAVHLSADALHLLAAGAWIGGLLPLGLILVTAYSEGESGWVPIARTATLRFSRLGIASVGTLLATGVVNTWILAGSVPALIGTDYGHLLLIKIALFAMMMALAAINRLRLTPLLSNESAPLQRGALRRLARNATAELALGLAIFGVVGALGTLPPGLHAQPVWPLPFRLSTDILADPDFGSRALVAVAVAVVGVALILGGLLQPKRRWLLIFAGVLVVSSVARELTGFFDRASPTTFYASPTGYSAESIAEGHQIFLENCAVSTERPAAVTGRRPRRPSTSPPTSPPSTATRIAMVTFSAGSPMGLTTPCRPFVRS
jgi:putative copper resistance protein D